mmetsp:Transcript_19608/g.66152  ORF Transcript_19608/g.66152 Transcript_19608/m.66152 type:complete len:604 (+) Transcript_19608:110-1921(+)
MASPASARLATWKERPESGAETGGPRGPRRGRTPVSGFSLRLLRLPYIARALASPCGLSSADPAPAPSPPTQRHTPHPPSSARSTAHEGEGAAVGLRSSGMLPHRRLGLVYAHKSPAATAVVAAAEELRRERSAANSGSGPVDRRAEEVRRERAAAALPHTAAAAVPRQEAERRGCNLLAARCHLSAQRQASAGTQLGVERHLAPYARVAAAEGHRLSAERRSEHARGRSSGNLHALELKPHLLHRLRHGLRRRRLELVDVAHSAAAERDGVVRAGWVVRVRRRDGDGLTAVHRLRPDRERRTRGGRRRRVRLCRRRAAAADAAAAAANDAAGAVVAGRSLLPLLELALRVLQPRGRQRRGWRLAAGQLAGRRAVAVQASVEAPFRRRRWQRARKGRRRRHDRQRRRGWRQQRPRSGGGVEGSNQLAAHAEGEAELLVVGVGEQAQRVDTVDVVVGERCAQPQQGSRLERDPTKQLLEVGGETSWRGGAGPVATRRGGGSRSRRAEAKRVGGGWRAGSGGGGGAVRMCGRVQVECVCLSSERLGALAQLVRLRPPMRLLAFSHQPRLRLPPHPLRLRRRLAATPPRRPPEAKCRSGGGSARGQ